MAKAWPMLENLSICNYLSIPSEATLNGLASFSKHCPKLATLRLRLDAREVPTPADTTHVSRDEAHEGDRTAVLLHLDVAAEILDPTGVASFLLNLFPRIVFEMDHSAETRHRVLWQSVVNIIEGTQRQKLDVPRVITSWGP
ncbi:hypothetical protein PAXINDRAFT_18152 [Paxillus involutus ATCC 200175]|uniref:F-box domain-containing protein n=1 Tax=Paxillus involutus ATCC 200175 TaxID=664439 RepID=A0A0C9SZK6_PAXIN|nr:hypothetical protein PAXINDRAFT_18152 [Paxillus involutus ATCC 200175]